MKKQEYYAVKWQYSKRVVYGLVRIYRRDTVRQLEEYYNCSWKKLIKKFPHIKIVKVTIDEVK